MKEFIIKKNDCNQRLDTFLQKAVPLLPKNLLYKYIRKKRIKINGKRAEINDRLSEGDKLELYINDEFFEGNSNTVFKLAPDIIDIIYEDENILLVNKPIGLCVHEDNDNSVDTLINRILHYLYNKAEFNPDDELSFTPALCNRIDRNTSGIVIAAKNAEALRILNEKIKNREVKKFYLCIVSGILKPKEAELKDYLVRNENESTVKVFSKPKENAKTIVTKYKVLKYSDKNSLVEVELKTGRTHQIRAHFSFIGHPLIGDGKYGIGTINKEYNQKTQLLCSYKLRFEWDDKDNLLGYLNNKEFSIKDVWFYKEFNDLF